MVLVTGQSGSGKSTLARCLNGLIPHATKGFMDGEVIVAGMNTKEYDTPDFARHVGMVFQDPGYQLVAGDVESEIAFGLECNNLPEQEIHRRIDETAALFRIGHLLGRSTSDLSWGERQRVAIASVIALQPSLLVMDEPFSGIDAAAARNLADIFEELSSVRGTTIIVFEHRTACLLPQTDRQIVMEGGIIIADRKRGLPAAVPAGSPVPELDSITVHSDRQARVPSLSFQEVSYQYPEVQAPALDGITLNFYPGEITVISGANGSGKTTLLKHCNGLLRPDRGVILLGPEPLTTKTVAAIAHSVGLLNQHADYQLFESTITEELAFGPKNIGKTHDEIEKIVVEMRNQCSLGHIDLSTPPLSLSGGEKQRVALASILAMDTPIVVLDEPTFGLDQSLKDLLTGLLRSLCAAEKTVIVATHDEAFGMACGDRFIRISAGRITADDRNPSRAFPVLYPDKREVDSVRSESTGES